MSTEPSTPREGESLQLRIATIIQEGRNDTAYEVAGRVLDEMWLPGPLTLREDVRSLFAAPTSESPRP